MLFGIFGKYLQFDQHNRTHLTNKHNDFLFRHRPDELPRSTKLESESGLKIKFHKNELIENRLESGNIELSQTIGKCKVVKARENESMKEILSSNENTPMAYICRYKLVRETVYKLVPVDWLPGEEEMRQSGGMSDDDEHLTDAQEHNESVVSLSDSINQLHVSYTEKTVSPIKIMNKNKVVSSRESTTSAKKRSSPDAHKPNNEVSPSKRSKAIEQTVHLVGDSPGSRNTRFESPTEKRMSRIKKDLNKSFSTDVQSEVEESPRSPYHAKVDAENPLRMQLIKGRILRERNVHENRVPSPLAHANGSVVYTRQQLRRSILKAPDSAKSRRNNSIYNFVHCTERFAFD